MSETISVETSVPGKNGGRLLAGGKKGHKGGSGRPPEWFKAFCCQMITSPKARAAAKAVLENPNHTHYASMWKAVSERGYGKPEAKVDVVVKHYRAAIEEVRTGLRLVAR